VIDSKFRPRCGEGPCDHLLRRQENPNIPYSEIDRAYRVSGAILDPNHWLRSIYPEIQSCGPSRQLIPVSFFQAAQRSGEAAGGDGTSQRKKIETEEQKLDKQIDVARVGRFKKYR
jgi:hypothetical protein